MSTFDCDQAEAFLGLLFGDRPGTVCLAFGRDPYRSRDGKYKHRSWSERDDKPRTDLYRWPAERDRLLDDVAREIAPARSTPTSARAPPRRREGPTQG